MEKNEIARLTALLAEARALLGAAHLSLHFAAIDGDTVANRLDAGRHVCTHTMRNSSRALAAASHEIAAFLSRS